jgi:hypothetical protein
MSGLWEGLLEFTLTPGTQRARHTIRSHHSIILYAMIFRSSFDCIGPCAYHKQHPDFLIQWVIRGFYAERNGIVGPYRSDAPTKPILELGDDIKPSLLPHTHADPDHGQLLYCSRNVLLTLLSIPSGNNTIGACKGPHSIQWTRHRNII